jgi:glycosyltransferase involved in cell wall biosynthesis
MPQSVLLTSDGTYPCYGGGVSVWCDQLIRALPDFDFHSLAICASPSHQPIFERPSNLRGQHLLPLWGTEEPGAEERDFVPGLLAKLRTSHRAIEDRFLPLFRACLRAIHSPEPDPEALGRTLASLHQYFQEFDYARSFSSPLVWECFLSELPTGPENGQEAEEWTLADAKTSIRWLRRFLVVAATPLPHCDVVHSSMAGLAGIPGVIAKCLRGTPFLLTEHGIYLRELYLSLERMTESKTCRRFLYNWFQAVARMNYHYADAVSSLCEFNRRWQIRVGAVPERIHLIPNGIDPSAFFPDPALRPQDPVILTMARIYPLKGIDVLIHAAKRVLDRVPHAKFRILGEVGDEPYALACKRQAEEYGIAESLEWSSTRNPAPEYRRATVFCLPSISEAMPYSVLEAMFSACPVVASEVGGIADMLGGCGLLAPPKDADALARAILSLIEGEGAEAYREDLAQRALHRAAQQFTTSVCVERFKSLYERYSQHANTSSLLNRL